MSKRNKVVIETAESRALKELRSLKGISLQEVADLLGVSKQQVYFMESGRANIIPCYVEQFIKRLDFSKQDWQVALGGENKTISQAREKLSKDCISKIQDLSEDKLKLLHSILSGADL